MEPHEQEQDNKTAPPPQSAQPPAAITLRRFDLSDIDDMMVWATDENVSRSSVWETYNRKEDLLLYLQKVVLPHPWYRAICIAGRAVGSIWVSPVTLHRWRLGYALGSAHWGQGIMTAAVKAVLSTVFQEIAGLKRLEALVDVDNPASVRVLEKAGFQIEGVLRNYAVLKGRAWDLVILSFLSTDPMVG